MLHQSQTFVQVVVVFAFAVNSVLSPDADAVIPSAVVTDDSADETLSRDIPISDLVQLVALSSFVVGAFEPSDDCVVSNSAGLNVGHQVETPDRAVSTSDDAYGVELSLLLLSPC